jgi:CMP-N-acetylneuraminic acid synthetase
MTGFAALVPMRHHSERVPEKNFRMVAGKPLYAYILETLLQCHNISEIVVDTDSPTIKEGLSSSYPQVRVIDRPENLRGDMISMNEILLYDVSQLGTPYFLQTHSTNPLLKGETVEKAIDNFLIGFPTNDSLFSVTRVQTRLWTEDLRPINHDPSSLIRTQDLPPVFEENSCIYIFEREAFLKHKLRIGERPSLFEIDPLEALDIDEESDLQIAECLLKGGHGVQE